MTPDIIAALEAFAAYADPRRSVPASMPVTSGSSMARKQLTMGDCYAAADALAALSTSPAGQEVRGDVMIGEFIARWEEAADGVMMDADNAEALAREFKRMRGLIYCPGVLRCAKCDFRLIKTTLTPAGAFANEEPDSCPNCNVPMWKVTWQDEAKEAYKVAESQMDRALKAERALPSVEPAGNGREGDAWEQVGFWKEKAEQAERDRDTWKERAMDLRLATPPAPALDVVSLARDRVIMSSVRLGKWMSAALDDPNVCEEMKADIRDWFSAGEPVEGWGAALSSPSEGESAPASSGAGDDLRKALKEARDALLTVGNDYPGSSCQRWCTDKARDAWNALQPWKHCPSTHCERAQECRSVNECSAEGATLTAPLSHDAEGESATVSREPMPDTRTVCEQCGKLGAFFCDHVGTPATSTERGR